MWPNSWTIIRRKAGFNSLSSWFPRAELDRAPELGTAPKVPLVGFGDVDLPLPSQVKLVGDEASAIIQDYRSPIG